MSNDDSKQSDVFRGRNKRGRVDSSPNSNNEEGLHREEQLGNSGISGNSGGSSSNDTDPLVKLEGRVKKHVLQVRRAAFDLYGKISRVNEQIKQEQGTIEEIKKHVANEAPPQQPMQVDDGAAPARDSRSKQLLDTARWGFKKLQKPPIVKNDEKQLMFVHAMNKLNSTYALESHLIILDHLKQQAGEWNHQLGELIPKSKEELQTFCGQLAAELSNDNPMKAELLGSAVKFEQKAFQQVKQAEAIVKLKHVESREKKALEAKKKEEVIREADLMEANILQNAQTLKSYVSKEISKMHKSQPEPKQQGPKPKRQQQQQQQKPRRQAKNAKERPSSQPPPTRPTGPDAASPATTSRSSRGRGRANRGRGRGGGRGRGTRVRGRGKGRGGRGGNAAN